jgi:adenylate cyclase
VRRVQESLRIAVELCDARDGVIIWSDRFDGRLDELFELQDRIAIRVATSVVPHLRDQELSRALRKHPDSMTAYDLTLQALDLFHRVDRVSLEQAGELLERAISVDPNYGPAFSHLAGVRMRIIAQGWSTDEDADRALAAKRAHAALERDPNDPVALSIYGHIQSYLLKNYQIALQYLERALEVGPSCPLAWGFSSLTCGYLGEHEKGVTRAERALRLCPIGFDSCRYQHYLAQAYFLARRYEEAVAWGSMSAVLAPANISNLICLTASLVALGDIETARARGRDMLQLAPGFRYSLWRVRTPLEPEDAIRVADSLRLAGLPE